MMKVFLLIGCVLYSLCSLANVSSFLNLELKWNPVHVKSNQPFNLDCYLIPLAKLESEFIIYKGHGLSKDIEKLVFLTKNGQSYFRWIVHPLDEGVMPDVLRYFRHRGVFPELEVGFFSGMWTSSDTLFVQENGVKNGPSFKIKLPIRNPGNTVKHGPISWHEAKDAFLMNEYIYQMSAELKSTVFVSEPMVAGLPDLNLGLIIRSTELFESGNGLHYVPGFSIMHSLFLAEKFDTNEGRHRFWSEHYNKAVARSVAETYLKLGIVHDSPHSQNIIVEFDYDWRPTGRILFRDLSDLRIDRTFAEKRMQRELFDGLSPEAFLNEYVPFDFRLLWGMPLPAWMSNDEVEKWQTSFFEKMDHILKNDSSSESLGLKFRSSVVRNREARHSYSRMVK